MCLVRKMGINRTVSILLLACLTALPVCGPCALAQSDFPGQEPRWEPKTTRVFLVSLTRFKDGTAPWDTNDRLDGQFVRLLKSRGVPENHMVFLSDEQANTRNIKEKFDDFLSRSVKGEFLIFYFSSHGHYDAETGAFAYATYDGRLPFEWAFDSIERSFKGSHVLMFADCCYSGGIVEMASKRRTPIAYACLSSTYSHNIGFSGWRFFDCIMRGFGGSPVVDLNGNGRIELDELARFTEKHMAFVAEGRPMFTTTNGFDPKLVLADATGAKKDPKIGRYVEARYKGEWHKAEITDLRPGGVRVHHTEKGSTYNDWVTVDQIRPFNFPHFSKGTRLEVKGASSGKWYPATVMDSWKYLHFCRFDGYSPAYDEWVGPSRMRELDKSAAAGVSSNLSGRG